MTNHSKIALISLLLVQACTFTGSVTQNQRPAVKPTAAPSAKAKETVSATAKQGPALLYRPTGDVSVLSGTIALDANYIVASGGGNIVASGGGNIVASGGGNIVASGGGNIVASGGGNIVASGGGNIVASGGGNVVSNDGASLITNDGGSLAVDSGNAIITNDGGSLITNDGGSLITNDGGSLITNDGGSLITNDGGSRRLLADAPKVPVGQLLPVGGAQVAVRSLDTGKLLPLGKDPAGNDITTIVSNRQGKFELYLPTGVTSNIRVETAFRLSKSVARNNVLYAGTTGSCQVDEDTRLASQYLHDALASRLVALFLASDSQVASLAALSKFVDKFKEFHTEAANMPIERVRAAASRCADVMLAHGGPLAAAPQYDLPGADPDRMALARKRNEDRKLDNAAAVLTDVFRSIRRAVVARMRTQQAPEAYFDQLPPLVAYRTLLAPDFHFRRAADFAEFIGNCYLGADLPDNDGNTMVDRHRFAGIDALLEAKPLPSNFFAAPKWLPLFVSKPSPTDPPALSDGLGEDGIPAGETYRMSSGERAVAFALVNQLFVAEGADELRARLLEIIKGAK